LRPYSLSTEKNVTIPGCRIHKSFIWLSTAAMVCGDALVCCKGAVNTLSTSIATTQLVASVLVDDKLSGVVSTLVTGGVQLGQTLSNDTRLPLISSNGSTPAGR
jgi:acyl-CoA reductase-like NAD-dependent aldehyde dehydrogenase